MCLGSSAPAPVNARGQSLFGDPFESFGVTKELAGTKDPDAALKAWETGVPVGLTPHALDPAKAIEDAAKMAGLQERAAAGEGIGGLFGFGKYAGKVPDFGVPALPPLSTNAPKGGK